MRRYEHLEIGLAVLVSVVAIALHWHCATHMGPLWRDEINSVAMDDWPSLKTIWDNLQYDSFPILWHATLRCWLKLGLTSDDNLRLFGFLVGTATIAALWINARIFKLTSPLLALVLLELNPTIVRWGDSIRGHGLGMLLSIGILGSIWYLLHKPSYKTFLIALVLCLVAVQAQFYNAVLLFATGVAAMTVGSIRRNFRGVIAVGGVGAFCALSLLPYAPSIRQASTWNMVIHAPEFTLSLFLDKLSQAIGPLWGLLDVSVWAALFVTAAGATLLIRSQRGPRQRETDGDVRLFFLLGISVCLVGYFLFLKVLSYRTNFWYYIPLMGYSAVALDCILSSFRGKGFATLRIVAGGVLLCLWSPWAWGNLSERLTNVDLIADQITASAGSGDFIVVNPWEPSITFDRYYKGSNPWTTVPPAEFHGIHRFDIVKKAMMLPDPLQAVAPILSRMEAVLRAGHRVWLVGGAEFIPNNTTPLLLAPAPNSPYGWMNVAYYEMWSQNIGYFLQSHALSATLVNIPTAEKVSDFESPILVVVSGWRQ